ncbi:unnamed protein product [Heligmosomoides polygyrus]|uniref:Secreted protein n=1 Tax=Heligmosomoides polygyrus TaxID=6339 RepID=A0A183F859_HELPZ|nr:unnamed protein product [Heligmosomoides polygyrus]
MQKHALVWEEALMLMKMMVMFLRRPAPEPVCRWQRYDAFKYSLRIRHLAWSNGMEIERDGGAPSRLTSHKNDVETEALCY